MLLVAAMLSVALARSPDDKVGWAGVGWGTEPTYEMICEVEELDRRCYRPDGSDKDVGDVRLVQVSYYYGTEGLYQVLLVTQDREDADVLFGGLQLAYGAGERFGSRTRWSGQVVSVSFIPMVPVSGASVLYEARGWRARSAKAARAL